MRETRQIRQISDKKTNQIQKVTCHPNFGFPQQMGFYWLEGVEKGSQEPLGRRLQGLTTIGKRWMVVRNKTKQRLQWKSIIRNTSVLSLLPTNLYPQRVHQEKTNELTFYCQRT